jgi:hypothetical protein
MVMTLYMTVVKQHSQHIMTPTITLYMIVVKKLTLTTKHKTVQLSLPYKPLRCNSH